jgi:hypothetical protein
LVLGILYSIEDDGLLAENTFPVLKQNGFTRPNKLATIVKGSSDWKTMVNIFHDYYGKRLINIKTQYIIEAAAKIEKLGVNFNDYSELLNGDEDLLLEAILGFKGINIKAFWVMREMRMQGVWDISGKYCCVPDKQVFNALLRWQKITNPNKSISIKKRKECSEEIWKYWSDLYDLPILSYARGFKCNDKTNRNCSLCQIGRCTDRHIPLLATNKCNNCGHTLMLSARFCSMCGANV